MDAAVGADAGPGLAPLAGLARIALEQHQGGPAMLRCDGVVYAWSVDLASNRWTVGTCAGASAHAPLASRHGVFIRAQRTRLDEAYARLAVATQPGRGNDGGDLVLTLTRTDATTERYADQNRGCRRPPPRVATGLREFGQDALALSAR